MSFAWFEDTGLYAGALSGTSKSPRILKLRAGSLAALASYTFRVVGWMTDDPAINNTATVEVEVAQRT